MVVGIEVLLLLVDTVSPMLQKNDKYRDLEGYIGLVGELAVVSSKPLCRVVSHLLGKFAARQSSEFGLTFYPFTGSNLNAHLTITSNCQAARELERESNANPRIRIVSIDQVQHLTF